MIGRIAWWTLLLGVAVVCIGVQLDRQARKTPTLAESVPAPFRSSAQLAVAAFALDAGNPEVALAEAQTLIRRRPLPAEHLRVLAQAQVAAGDVDGGTLTIQYAAQRGWRDPLAQEAMLRLALEAGDTSEAARRYAALFLRPDTEGALLIELGEPVLGAADSEGRVVLAEIVAGGERWHNQFLRRGAMVLPPDAFADIVRRAAEDGAGFECDLLRSVGERLARRDAAAGAELSELARGTCAS